MSDLPSPATVAGWLGIGSSVVEAPTPDEVAVSIEALDAFTAKHVLTADHLRNIVHEHAARRLFGLDHESDQSRLRVSIGRAWLVAWDYADRYFDFVGEQERARGQLDRVQVALDSVREDIFELSDFVARWKPKSRAAGEVSEAMRTLESLTLSTTELLKKRRAARLSDDEAAEDERDLALGLLAPDEGDVVRLRLLKMQLVERKPPPTEEDEKAEVERPSAAGETPSDRLLCKLKMQMRKLTRRELKEAIGELEAVVEAASFVVAADAPDLFLLLRLAEIYSVSFGLRPTLYMNYDKAGGHDDLFGEFLDLALGCVGWPVRSARARREFGDDGTGDAKNAPLRFTDAALRLIEETLPDAGARLRSLEEAALSASRAIAHTDLPSFGTLEHYGVAIFDASPSSLSIRL